MESAFLNFATNACARGDCRKCARDRNVLKSKSGGNSGCESEREYKCHSRKCPASVFTSEALLTAIVESRNPQQLYEAQNIARAKLKQIKDGQMVKRPDKLVGDF